MRRSIPGLIVALILLTWISGCRCRPSSRGELQDAGAPAGDATAGSVRPAIRLISLMPSGTEVVAALGATDLLVGVDDYSKFPAEISGLPKIGSYLAPNVEAILALRPTLVIVDDVHGRAATALRGAGIDTLPCAVHSLADVKTALAAVGDRLGRAREAEAVVARIEAAIDRARERRPARRPRVLAVIDREAGGLGNLIAAGPGSWVDELLAIVGVENVLSRSGVRYPKISIEEVLRSAPDVILDLSFPARTEITAWNRVAVPAVRDRRVIGLHEPYLTAPSPRVEPALRDLRTALRLE